MTSFKKFGYDVQARSQTEFSGASENLEGQSLHAGGDFKQKGFQCGKPPFSASFVVISKKRSSVRKATIFCDFYISNQIYCKTFSFHPKLKDLSEIYLGGKIKFGRGATTPLLPLPTCLLVTLL